MGLTNAQKQARWRARREALVRSHPQVVEGELIRAAERCGGLSAEERRVLADRLQDAAMRHLWRSHELNWVATKVRAGGR
jgi:hypothetical protein